MRNTKYIDDDKNGFIVRNFFSATDGRQKLHLTIIRKFYGFEHTQF